MKFWWPFNRPDKKKTSNTAKPTTKRTQKRPKITVQLEPTCIPDVNTHSFELTSSTVNVPICRRKEKKTTPLVGTT